MKNMKERVWDWLVVIFLLLLSVILIKELRELLPYRTPVAVTSAGETIVMMGARTGLAESGDGIEEDHQQVMDSETPPVGFDTLKAVNSELVGWIRIPGTRIDYPIVQAENNEKYLHTGFDEKENVSGSIFLDYESQSDFRGKNTVIYGHNMKNGTMFKDIINFKEETYFKEHQNFDIYTPDRVIHLKVIACYYDKADAIIRKMDFRDDNDFQNFVKEILKPCLFSEVPETNVDRLYTLVTCSYEKDDARTYLFAIENDDFEPNQNKD